MLFNFLFFLCFLQMSSHTHTHAILGNYIRKLSKVKLKAIAKFELAVNISYTYTGYNK